ncbi:dynamin family protein [Pseudoalteromonas sp. 2CM41L]|uniref:dynamin family protein n=1 Tax=Pseudoalteromonas sp. 2CM41L TaxID=2929857 RepID=UPI0020C05CDA|nr:dynamin family protein [Pseudoalteromonas sp. 2CM41L]MCK8107746.1 dynamin family protein [Pseudoalteromonas sp. 2CM41L]
MQIHQSTIFDVQEQTLSLLKSSQSIIDRLIEDKELHVKNGLVEASYLDDAKSILKNEYQKANELEMVIAVVGTMKAGKSTTINAIVGHEVLPNRNYPMTALPTVVTHVKGQSIPTLNFTNKEPIIKLSQRIAKKINGMTVDEAQVIDFFHHKDVEGILSTLKSKGQLMLSNLYEGQEEIFQFLKTLNDIMRLAKELDIEPPYEAYRFIDDLPTIEVEFQHLSQAEQQEHGKLSIIDTPGPNEFGQSEKLKAIFKEQLQKASAVLLVVDYTQMNSEAGGAVREEITSVQNSLGERFFVMLNKFDAKTKNDNSKEDTVSFFCNQLMDGSISPENVFPVSAQRAFLANRAINELQSTGSLNVQENWVPDFGQIAFGEDWEDDIDDVDDVKKKALKIWKKSGFETPLENVILEASNNAALLSLESALSQLDTINSQLGEGVNSYKEAISISVDSLRDAIKNIESDKLKIEVIQTQTKKSLSEQSQAINLLISTLSQKAIKDAAEQTKQLFNRENNLLLLEQKKTKKADVKGNQQKPMGAFFSFLNLKNKSNSSNKESFENLIKKGEIKFEEYEKDNAKKFLTFINSALKKIQNNAHEKTFSELNKIILDSNKDINDKVEAELKDILRQASVQLNDSGLTMTLSLNKISTKSKSTNLETISTTVKKSTESRRYTRVKDSWFSKAVNWFSDDWGTETYYEDEVVYIIKVDDIKKKSSIAIEKAMDKISMNANQYLSEHIQPQIEAYINDVSNYLEKYRKTLIAGLSAQKKSKEAQELLIQRLEIFGDEIKCIVEDTNDSKDDLKSTV